MGLRSALLLALCLVTPGIASAQDAWEQDLAKRHQQLIDQNGPGTDTALRDQLLTLRDQDRTARGLGPSAKPGQIAIATNLAEIDQSLTDRLKSIVTSKGWPTIALVGIDASNAAMTLLTHTPDHEWQRSLLPNLEQLADTGKIDGSALALVIDKELVASGHLQRYGTQFKMLNSAMAMFAVEDPSELDRRRAQVLLPPMEVYKQQLVQLYHAKLSNQIVMATASAPAK